MASDYVKHRLKQKAALAPRGDSNEPVLELCREFAQEAFIAGISMAFQEWVSNYVSATQQTAVRRYLIARLPGIILNQYLSAQKILAPVELADQLQYGPPQIQHGRRRWKGRLSIQHSSARS